MLLFLYTFFIRIQNEEEKLLTLLMITTVNDQKSLRMQNRKTSNNTFSANYLPGFNISDISGLYLHKLSSNNIIFLPSCSLHFSK